MQPVLKSNDACVVQHALKRLTEHAKRIDHPDQRVGVTLGRYLSARAIASPAVTNKELDLLSAHIRKVTECLGVHSRVAALAPSHLMSHRRGDREGSVGLRRVALSEAAVCAELLDREVPQRCASLRLDVAHFLPPTTVAHLTSRSGGEG